MSNSAVVVHGKTMRWSGPNCTPRAVMERLKKLKKNANVRMDETSPHVVGSTCKMEAEFRAKREAEFAAVQPRKSRTMKVKTLPESPGEDSEPGLKKTDARANTATTGRSRNKKGTARIIKKRKVKPTQEILTESETEDSSNAGEDPSMDEPSHAGVSPNATKAHNHSHKRFPFYKSNHHRHQEEAMKTDTLSPSLPTRNKRPQEAIDTDPPSPSQPPQKKRQQAPASVIQLESDNESSTPPPVKKRKQEKDKVADRPPTSTAVKHHRKHTSNAASREGED
ncbi:hypothetical protein JMJ35_009261 [Cladonia borealis]|uniref:Uncharacterized protein n=1 Tax=Cladonia borealis TaxID=184061 RepID=A0AA39QS47_9LECA|nr:hypothetical protein JMJ35_009261 [Cladonia borealis]